MSAPAARVGDMHVCPKSTSKTPHVGGPVAAGCPTVLIGGAPAARVGDMAVCVGPPDKIASGSSTVLIGGKQAAHVGSRTAHGGAVVVGFPTVLVASGKGGGAVARVASKFQSLRSAVVGIARSAPSPAISPVAIPAAASIAPPRRIAPSELDGRQFKVCRTRDPADASRTVESIEEVERRNDGTYVAVGSVDPSVGLASPADVRRYAAPRPVPPSFPAISHLNGIDNSPDEALAESSWIADHLVADCPAYPRQACVLATYSADRGTIGDVAEAALAKVNVRWWKVQQQQERQMQDAIGSGRRITISAHSRGSIHTENAWREVRAAETSRLLKEQGATYAQDPSVKRAVDAASKTNRHTDIGTRRFEEARARRRAMRRLAETDAADLLNRHVTVVTSGNAVWMPDPSRRAIALVAEGPDGGKDLISTWFGHTRDVGGVKVVPVEGDESLLKHAFPEMYSPGVAEEHCRAITSPRTGASS